VDDTAMTDDEPKKLTQQQQKDADKKDRLAGLLRANLRKRKGLQRDRGETAPDAIKNKNRMID